jgi:hypothetical protein
VSEASEAEDEGEEEYGNDDEEDEDSDDDSDDEGHVVYEMAEAVQPVRAAAVRSHQVIQAVKGSIVTITRQAPPPIPTRSAARNSRYSLPPTMDVPSPTIQAVSRNARSESLSEFNATRLKRDDDGDDDGTIYSKHTSSIFTSAQGNRWSMAPTEDVSILDDDSASMISHDVGSKVVQDHQESRATAQA